MGLSGKYTIEGWKKVALWLFSSLLALIFVAFLILFFGAERIINKNLSDFVYEKSDSIYRFSFDNIDLNFKQKTLTVSDLVFQPDEAFAADTTKKYYSLKSPSLVISKIDIIKLLKEKRFVIESLKIDNPTFGLSTGEEVNLESFANNKISMGDSLTLPMIKEISIDTMLITNALMQVDSLFRSKHKIPRVNLEIVKFRIGGTKTTKSPFPFDVDDISLRVENVHTNLTDNVHQLDVKEISLSLLNSKIRAKEVELKPLSADIKSTENKYTIVVPEINLFSHHVELFYSSDTIPIESLVLNNPSITIEFGTKVVQGTPLNEINLFKLVEKNLKWIKVDTFSIKNANLDMIPNGEKNSAQSIQNLTVNFYHFLADSSSYRQKNRILSALDLDIFLENFTLNHNDNVHQLIINNIEANTKERKVETGSITFKPLKNRSAKTISTLIDIKSKGLTFKDINFFDMYHKQIIPMRELDIRSPEAKVSFDKNKPIKKKSTDTSLILEKIKDYIKGVYVKKTSIKKGKLYYSYDIEDDKSGFFETEFNFELNDLSIDSATFYSSDKIFFAENFNVLFSNINLQLADNFHRMLTDSINLSSQGQKAEIFNLRIIPLENYLQNDTVTSIPNEIFDIHFPKIQFSGADFHRAFFKKELCIEDFSVINPTFNIEKYGDWQKNTPKQTTNYQSEFYSLIKDYLFKINIQTMELENGSIGFKHHQKNQPLFEMSNLFSIKTYNFELDSLSSQNKNKLFFSDNIDLVLKKQSFAFADGVHKVDAAEIGILSTQKLIYVKNAKMYPNTSSPNFKKLPMSIYANIPSIQFTGTDILELINNGDFPVGAITISNPEIQLLLQPVAAQKSSSPEKPILILEDLKSLTATLINIENGKLELANFENGRSKTFATTDIDLTVNKFKIENIQNQIKTSYSNFTYQFQKSTFNLPDNIHKLSLEKCTYQLSSKQLKAFDFKIKPIKDSKLAGKTDIFNVEVPELTLSDFDFFKFIEEKKLIASALLINNPTVELLINKKEKTEKFSPYKMGLYPNMKETFEVLQIKQLTVNNSNIEIKGDNAQKLNHVNLKADGLLLDKNTDSSKKMFGCDNIYLEINNIGNKTKDGFYNYNIGKATINSNGDFSLTGVSLTPAYPEKEFNQKKKYQEDCYKINNIDCQGSGLNIDTFLETNEVMASNINIQFDKVEIYRNNTYPIRENFTMDLPQKQLRELSQKFDIRKANVSCNNLLYREITPESLQETQVFFTNIQSEITNITNIKSNYTKNPITHLDIKGKLMGIGEMKVAMDLNMASLKNEFTVNAECGYLPFSELSSITEPGLMLSIKEGYNKKLEVNFEANEDSSSGEIKFAYNDLKITVLSNKEGKIKEEKFISFLANTLAVKADNPSGKKEIVPQKFVVMHDPKRSFINYCWNSILSGIKETFGIKEKTE